VSSAYVLKSDMDRYSPVDAVAGLLIQELLMSLCLEKRQTFARQWMRTSEDKKQREVIVGR